MTTTEEGIEVKEADEVLRDTLRAEPTSTHTRNIHIEHGTARNNNRKPCQCSCGKVVDRTLRGACGRLPKLLRTPRLRPQRHENEQPTNKLIDNYNRGNGDNALMLEQLYFAYGRYLEIASSRGVDLPSNLQGIWNNIDVVAWNSDIHSNINVQMNYWPAETTNLQRNAHAVPQLYMEHGGEPQRMAEVGTAAG